MTAVALVRAPLRPLEVEESWDKELVGLAQRLLGYSPKALAQAEVVRTRSLNEAILARALEKLGIEPFTLSSVQAYKAQMLRETLRAQSHRMVRYMHASGEHKMQKGQTVVYALGIPAWGSFIVTAILSACLHFAGTNYWGWDGHKSVELTRYMPLEGVGPIMALPTLAVATWAFLMYLRHKNAVGVVADWRISNIGINANRDEWGREAPGYAEAIPAFALQRMVSLKEELPEVTFSVEQLNSRQVDLNTQKAKPLPPDPFLLVNFRGISAYIDVWDEPKFEGRRTV